MKGRKVKTGGLGLGGKTYAQYYIWRINYAIMSQQAASGYFKTSANLHGPII